MRRHMRLVLLATTFVVLLGAATVAGAAAPSSGNHAGAALKKKPKVLRGPRGPRGPRGFAGPSGPTGPAGPAGAPGLSGYQRVGAATVPVPADGSDVTAFAECPAGKQALSGSYFTTPGTGIKVRTESSAYGISDTTGHPGWQVTVANDGTVASTLHVSVICATVS